MEWNNQSWQSFEEECRKAKEICVHWVEVRADPDGWAQSCDERCVPDKLINLMDRGQGSHCSLAGHGAAMEHKYLSLVA